MTSVRLVSKLGEELVDRLHQELEQFPRAKHGGTNTGYNKVYGPLRHGSTLYLRNWGDSVVRYTEKFRLVPAFLEVVASVFGVKPDSVRKAYYHVLGPDDRIDLHTDISSQFQATKRFHIYFNATTDLNMFVGDQHCLLERGDLIEFPMQLAHRYHNKSDHEIGFLVMDLPHEMCPG